MQYIGLVCVNNYSLQQQLSVKNNRIDVFRVLVSNCVPIKDSQFIPERSQVGRYILLDFLMRA